MQIRVILAASALLAASTAANAQSNDHFRVEAIGGWDDVVAHEKFTDSAGDQFTARGSKSGATYGVGTGFDIESETGLVFGPIASVMWSSAKSCGSDDFGDRSCIKPGRDIEAGARVGQRYSGSGTLAYVKLAYVNDRINASLSDGVDEVSSHENRSGVRVGLGLEQPIGSRLYVKAEYRYTDLKDQKIADADESLRFGFERHQVVAGIGARF